MAQQNLIIRHEKKTLSLILKKAILPMGTRKCNLTPKHKKTIFYPDPKKVILPQDRKIVISLTQKRQH